MELSEWRVVGPGLAGLIVALSLRFRLSRARIQEFLHEWLGVEPSIGTIHQALHEAAVALAPAEDELVDAVLASGLLHADETSWPERGQPLWPWAFTAATVTVYHVADRRQGALFDPGDGERSRALMATVDRINARLGRGTLRFGTEGFQRGWAMRQAHRSPAYTTRWEELPVVG